MGLYPLPQPVVSSAKISKSAAKAAQVSECDKINVLMVLLLNQSVTRVVLRKLLDKLHKGVDTELENRVTNHDKIQPSAVITKYYWEVVGNEQSQN